jgi:hypothetical protein
MGGYPTTNCARFFSQHGIVHEASAPRTSAELTPNAAMTMSNGVRSMLRAGLPRYLWAKHPVLQLPILNISSLQAEACTPRGGLTGERPDVCLTSVFGVALRTLRAHSFQTKTVPIAQKASSSIDATRQQRPTEVLICKIVVSERAL